MFPGDQWGPLLEGHVRKLFERVLRKAELPHFRVYDLRHTFASVLLSEGVPLLYVSKQLGHSKPTTTLQYYAKGFPAETAGTWTCWIGRQQNWHLRKVGTKSWHQKQLKGRKALKCLKKLVGPPGLEPGTS